VLVKELQSLGLAVESIMEDGEIVSYGKESDRRTGPLPTGLLDSRSGA
jgi:DNA-directed RNA polymerase subunit beta